jgi:hypothetical protein
MMREARRRYAEWCLLPEKSREKACTQDGVSGWLHKVQGKGAGWWHATGMLEEGQEREEDSRAEKRGGGGEGREGEEERGGEKRTLGQAFSDVAWLLGHCTL